MLSVGVSRGVFSGIRYAKSHEWVRAVGENEAEVGISDHAQKELGDLVFVDLPAVGSAKAKGQTLCNVESVKSVSDVYSPVSCEVIESNKELTSSPTLLNKDAEGKAWIAKVRLTKLDEFETLLDKDAYDAHCKAEKAAHH